ncbi:MAG: hypothetical protein OEL87_00950 [Nanoarchaeota archaeon]|nr:hypothetical protein [Nanoarchaeota archaeon]
MKLKKITYFVDGKKKTANAKILKNPLEKAVGLMFQKNSPPLLFVSKKFQWNPITSLFCKPFKAIWLDEKMKATKVVDVKNWKLNISGHGKFLLEIPKILNNNKSPSTKSVVSNRNI